MYLFCFKNSNSMISHKLQLPNGCNIKWTMWVDAYVWDTTNPVAIHRKLTSQHVIDLNSANKMRNHLAEEVLNADMLQLMMDYR